MPIKLLNLIMHCSRFLELIKYHAEKVQIFNHLCLF